MLNKNNKNKNIELIAIAFIVPRSPWNQFIVNVMFVIRTQKFAKPFKSKNLIQYNVKYICEKLKEKKKTVFYCDIEFSKSTRSNIIFHFAKTTIFYKKNPNSMDPIYLQTQIYNIVYYTDHVFIIHIIVILL